MLSEYIFTEWQFYPHRARGGKSESVHFYVNCVRISVLSAVVLEKIKWMKEWKNEELSPPAFIVDSIIIIFFVLVFVSLSSLRFSSL